MAPPPYQPAAKESYCTCDTDDSLEESPESSKLFKANAKKLAKKRDNVRCECPVLPGLSGCCRQPSVLTRPQKRYYNEDIPKSVNVTKYKNGTKSVSSTNYRNAARSVSNTNYKDTARYKDTVKSKDTSKYNVIEKKYDNAGTRNASKYKK